jgi:hypothetical protein
MASETEAAAVNTTINYEAASTAVETPVVVMAAAAVDAAAAPNAGNSVSGCSGGGVDIGSGKTAVMIATAMATVTATMTTSDAETAAVAAARTKAAVAATEAITDSNQ